MARLRKQKELSQEKLAVSHFGGRKFLIKKMKYFFYFGAIIIYPIVFLHTINGLLSRLLLSPGISQETLVRFNEVVSLSVYLFAVVSLIYFSLHSVRSYQKNVPWKSDLLLSIIIFWPGVLLSLKGFSYAALFILPLSIVLFLTWLVILKFLFSKSKTNLSGNI